MKKQQHFKGDINLYEFSGGQKDAAVQQVSGQIILKILKSSPRKMNLRHTLNVVNLGYACISKKGTTTRGLLG